MKTIYSIVVVAFYVTLLQLFGCGGDPEPDPCLDKKPVKADFTIGELISFFGGNKPDTIVLSDTVLTGNFIVFNALDNYESYEWRVGDDPRVFNTKQLKLLFQFPETLTVSLTVKGKALKNCFPDDDGMDTQVRKIVVIDRKLNPIFGQYEGAIISNPGDVFKVEVVHDAFFDQINIININKNCYPINESIGLRGFRTIMCYKKLYFYSGFYYESCKDPQGWLIVDKAIKNVEIRYSTGNGSVAQSATKRIYDKFIGKKID